MKCSYVLSTWGKKPDGSIDYSKPPVQCGKRVGWKMVQDDDDRTVRAYNPFCDEHQKKVDETHIVDDEFCGCKACVNGNPPNA